MVTLVTTKRILAIPTTTCTQWAKDIVIHCKEGLRTTMMVIIPNAIRKVQAIMMQMSSFQVREFDQASFQY